VKKILPLSFFDRPVLSVAPDLLGKFLVHVSHNGATSAYMITEVEAYDGEKDKACHASKGRTKRTETLYAPPGTWYVYLCYGMHWMLNIVTCEKDYPAALLIRACVAEDGTMFKGPGVVTRELHINKELNGKQSTRISGLWLEERGVVLKKSDILRTPRIGVAYAGAWAEKPYRYVLKI